MLGRINGVESVGHYAYGGKTLAQSRIMGRHIYAVGQTADDGDVAIHFRKSANQPLGKFESISSAVPRANNSHSAH